MANYLDADGLTKVWGLMKSHVASTKYVHPANHPPSIITQDASNRFVTDTEKTNWNAKETTTGAQTKATTAQTNAAAYTDTKISALIGGATGAYDTLKEIEDLMEADASALGSLVDAIALKADKDVVTTTANGLMAFADKVKLNGIATGANKTTVDSSLSSTSTNPVQNKVVHSNINEISNTLTGLSTTVSGKANDSDVVKLVSTQTIDGIKSFKNILEVSNTVGARASLLIDATKGTAEWGAVPTLNNHLANKKYVDDSVGTALTSTQIDDICI